MQTKTIYYRGRIYQKYAVCAFVGAKMKVLFCSEDNKNQLNTKDTSEYGG